MSQGAREYWERCYSSTSPKSIEYFTIGHEAFLESFANNHLTEGDSVLILGCGGGRNATYLASLNFHIVGLDLSYKALQLARTKSQEALVQANMVSLPFVGSSFDAVVCLHTMDHLPLVSATQSLQEILRVLRPGAKGLFSFDGPQEECADEGEYELLQDGAKRYGEGNCAGLIFRQYDEEKISELFDKTLENITQLKNRSYLAFISAPNEKL